MKQKINIEIEVDIKSFPSKNGEVFEPKEDLVSNLKLRAEEMILDSVETQNKHCEKECSNANVIHEFESIVVNREDLKSYSEEPENYKKFLIYYLKNFQEEYNPLFLEHEEINPEIKYSLRAKALQTILWFKKVDLKYYSHYTDIEIVNKKMRYNHFDVTKENFEDFLTFVLDTGMISLDYELPDNFDDLVPISTQRSSFRTDIRAYNLIEGLIDMCIELDDENGFDLLINKYKIKLPKKSHSKGDYCYMKKMIIRNFSECYRPQYVGKKINSFDEAKEEFSEYRNEIQIRSKWKECVDTNKYIRWIGKITEAFKEHEIYINQSVKSMLGGYDKDKSRHVEIISFLNPEFVKNNSYKDTPGVKFVKKISTHKEFTVRQSDYNEIDIYYSESSYGDGWKNSLYIGNEKGDKESSEEEDFYLHLSKERKFEIDEICKIRLKDNYKNINDVKRLIEAFVNGDVTKNNYKEFLTKDTTEVEKLIREKEDEICKLKKRIGKDCK